MTTTTAILILAKMEHLVSKHNPITTVIALKDGRGKIAASQESYVTVHRAMTVSTSALLFRGNKGKVITNAKYVSVSY